MARYLRMKHRSEILPAKYYQIDLEARHRAQLGELDRKRQSNVAQTDDGYFFVIQLHTKLLFHG
jgi:hypothetical protein